MIYLNLVEVSDETKLVSFGQYFTVASLDLCTNVAQTQRSVGQKISKEQFLYKYVLEQIILVQFCKEKVITNEVVTSFAR